MECENKKRKMSNKMSIIDLIFIKKYQNMLNYAEENKTQNGPITQLEIDIIKNEINSIKGVDNNTEKEDILNIYKFKKYNENDLKIIEGLFNAFRI